MSARALPVRGWDLVSLVPSTPLTDEDPSPSRVAAQGSPRRNALYDRGDDGRSHEYLITIPDVLFC